VVGSFVRLRSMIPSGVRFFLAATLSTSRKGPDSLLHWSYAGSDPFNGVTFYVCSAQAGSDRIKSFGWDGVRRRFCISCEALEKAVLGWPRIGHVGFSLTCHDALVMVWNWNWCRGSPSRCPKPVANSLAE